MFDRTPVLLIDGDDTLWKAQEIYQAAEQQFFDLMTNLGFNENEVQRTFAGINRDLAQAGTAHERRFTQALLDTYHAFTEASQQQAHPETQAGIERIGASVFSVMPQPMDGVQQLLSTLSSSRYKLVFYSTGIERIQLERLTTLGLAQYFSGQTFVVPRKNKDTLLQITSQLAVNKRRIWVIGNSPRFDINPALELGLNCIWVHSDFWDYDQQEFLPTKLYVVFGLEAIPSILSHAAKQRR